MSAQYEARTQQGRDLIALVAARPRFNHGAPDYRVGVTHRMRKHYAHSKARGEMSAIARFDRDRTTQRVELSERVQDALEHQNPLRLRRRA